MKPMFYEQWKIESSLTPDEIIDRLKGQVDELTRLRSPADRGKHPLEAIFFENGFYIRQIFYWCSSWHTCIRGQIVPHENGATTRLKMTLTSLNIFFIIFIPFILMTYPFTIYADLNAFLIWPVIIIVIFVFFLNASKYFKHV